MASRSSLTGRPSSGGIPKPDLSIEHRSMPAPQRGGKPKRVTTDTRTEREKAKSKGYK